MKKIINFLLISSLLQFAFGQSRISSSIDDRDDLAFNYQVFYSYWINPVQFDENLIFNYRIRYDFLLFEKTPIDKPFADTFQARVKVILELSSAELLTPIRSIEEVSIKSADFENTISKNLFYSSSFSLKVPPKKYRVNFTIFDYVRNKEFTFRQFTINLEDSSAFEPIFIRESDLQNLTSSEIKNKFYNFLPFSSEKYILVLPDWEELNEIRIEDKFVKYTVKRKENTGLRFSLFELDTLNLIEGGYQLKWRLRKEKSKTFFVRWIDKPEYLKNLSNALNISKYLFENENSLSRYFADKDEQIRKFYEMWKKYDPTPATPFNELMSEFYHRADYASLEFKSVSQPDGALTDRGKIYILYGPPSKIERTFARDGRSLEIWTYNTNREIKFTFLDENKNGNFILQK